MKQLSTVPPIYLLPNAKNKKPLWKRPMDSACLRWLDEPKFICGHNGLDRGAYAKFCKDIAFVGSYGVLAAILKDGDILYLYALGQESEHDALRRSDDSALILLIFILIDQAQTFIADELFVAYSHPYAGLYLLSATLFQEYAEVGVFLDELQNKLGRFLSHYHPMGHIVVSDKFNHVSRHIILNHVGLYKAHIGRDAFYQR